MHAFGVGAWKGFERCVDLANLRGFLAVVLAIALCPAMARAAEGGLLPFAVVQFKPGSATENGHYDASVQLNYRVANCQHQGVRLLTGSEQYTTFLHSGYWYKGVLYSVPSNMLNTRISGLLKVKGRALANINLNRMEFTQSVAVGDMNCLSMDVVNLDPLKLKPDEASSVVIYLDAIDQTLRNQEFEKHIEQRLAEDRERKRQEEEQKRKEEAAQKQEEERLRQAREQKSTGPGGTGAAVGGTGATDDYWGAGSGSSGGSAGRRTAAAPACTGEVDYVRSTDGRYYQKGCSGQYTEVNQDDYYRFRKQQQDEAAQAERSRQQAQAVANLQQQQQRAAQRSAEFGAMVDRKVSGLQQSLQAGSALREINSNILDLGKLQAEYGSLEELDSDYRSRIAALDSAYEQMHDATNAGIDARVNMFFSGNQQEQAVGQVFGTFSKIAAHDRIEDEKKEARRELREQRERLEQEIAQKRWQKTVALRQSLLDTFVAGPVPLSSSRVNADVIYYFAYSGDRNGLNADKPVITLTDVFPVYRRSDGSWPFRNNLQGELAQVLPGQSVMVGFYLSSKEAEAQRSAFVDYAGKGGFALQRATYKGTRPPSSGSGAQDYWGDPSGGTGGAARRASDDYWGETPQGAPSGNGAAPAADSYW